MWSLVTSNGQSNKKLCPCEEELLEVEANLAVGVACAVANAELDAAMDLLQSSVSISIIVAVEEEFVVASPSDVSSEVSDLVTRLYEK